MTALLGGEPVDLSDLTLDLESLPPFQRRVCEAARAIPVGSTLTYGEIAARIGEPGAARAVGQALGANPFPIIVPCHRVLAAGGKPGGFSAPGGVTTKLRSLANRRRLMFSADGRRPGTERDARVAAGRPRRHRHPGRVRRLPASRPGRLQFRWQVDGDLGWLVVRRRPRDGVRTASGATPASKPSSRRTRRTVTWRSTPRHPGLGQLRLHRLSRRPARRPRHAARRLARAA
jgi:O-6-methylguanine DNA methyltransferase